MTRTKSPSPKILAYYLPQYHPIPENDAFFGAGFTEWTNVRKTTPLYPGHQQPRLPTDLGFYDLRNHEARILQAKLARDSGVFGFVYWHYWFLGQRVLEIPFNEVLSSQEPKLPFCLAWANESWQGKWAGAPGRLLIEQKYGGKWDYEKHFESLVPAFNDSRYIRVDNKPVFILYRPDQLPNVLEFTDTFREASLRFGFEGVFLIAISSGQRYSGFDGHTFYLNWPESDYEYLRAKYDLPHVYPNRIAYSSYTAHNREQRRLFPDFFPMVVPCWDNTPRAGRAGYVLEEATPETFRAHLKEVISEVELVNDREPFIFLKSWNEWAEGNTVEPCEYFGRGFLDAIAAEIPSVEVSLS